MCLSKEILDMDPCYHPKLYLLAIERTGWRRWVFGRWVYSSEGFRNDIARRARGMQILMESHERFVETK